MELSERYIQTLEEMGYQSISEEQFSALESWSDTTNNVSKIIMVTDGSLTITIAGQKHVILRGMKYSISLGTRYEASAGVDGVIFITGEKS